MLSAQKWCIKALFKHNAVFICITIRLHAILFFLFFWLLSKPTAQCPRLDSGQAAAELFCSHTHFHVTLTCQCAQNCQTLLKALDAMCNSFNTRPCRYPYHCCNGVFMPPCILRACTRQLVIHLIYSTRPAVDKTALVLCRRPEYTAGHSAAFVLQRWSQGHMWFYHRPEKHHSWLPICCFMRNKCGNTWRREKSWSKRRFIKRYRIDESQLICYFPLLTTTSFDESIFCHHQNRDCLCLFNM